MHNRAHTAAMIRAARATLLRRPRRRRLPRQQQPDASRVEYFRALREILARARELVGRRLLPELPKLIAEAEYERRFDDTRQVNRIADDLSKEFFDALRPQELEELAARYARQTSDFQRRQLARQIKAAAGVDVFLAEPNLAPRIAAFTAENVALIKSIPNKYLDDVEAVVTRGVRKGLRAEALGAEIADRFKVSESRAALIARDQIGKFYGELQQVRQEKLGIEEYIWQTVNDNRVRDEHRALQGKRIRWDDPPEDGHPGEAVNCVPGNTRLLPHARVLKAYRRGYSAQATTLITDTGKAVCATPNHPVLTGRGWIPAHLVEVGEDLWEAFAQGLDLAVGDPQGGETTAEEFFRAVLPLGTPHRIAALRGRFHGDVSDEEVDVVHVDWSLGDELDSRLSQSFCHHALALADDPGASLGSLALLFGRAVTSTNSAVRGFCKLAARLGAGLPHTQKHGSALAAWLDALLDKCATNRSSRDVEVLRELLYAPPLVEQQWNHVARVLFGVACRAVMTPTGLYSPRAQENAEAIALQVQLPGGFGDRAAVVQKAGRVAKKLVGELPRANGGTHVFNLETTSGWYIANGLVIHNCRCYGEPVLDDILAEL